MESSALLSTNGPKCLNFFARRPKHRLHEPIAQTPVTAATCARLSLMAFIRGFDKPTQPPYKTDDRYSNLRVPPIFKSLPTG